MNLVLDDAVEVHLKRHTRKPLKRIMLKEISSFFCFVFLISVFLCFHKKFTNILICKELSWFILLCLAAFKLFTIILFLSFSLFPTCQFLAYLTSYLFLLWMKYEKNELDTTKLILDDDVLSTGWQHHLHPVQRRKVIAAPSLRRKWMSSLLHNCASNSNSHSTVM